MRRRRFLTAIAALPFIRWWRQKPQRSVLPANVTDDRIMGTIPIPAPHGGLMQAHFDMLVGFEPPNADLAKISSDQIDFYFKTIRQIQGIPDVYDLPDRDMTKAQFLAALEKERKGS